MNRIILADDQSIFRAGVARVLSLEADMRIVAQVDDGARLLGAIAGMQSAIVLFSSGLKLDIAEVLAALRLAGSVGIVVAERGQTFADEVRAQIGGIIGRSTTAPELLDTIRRVARGQRCVQLAGVTEMPAQDAVGARVRDRLTPKELQIVALIVQGCKNKDIAVRLGTKEQVIKNYLRSIYDKTGVSDRLELALFTLHHRMLAEAAAKAGKLIEMRAAS